jgi:hypothetical protein
MNEPAKKPLSTFLPKAMTHWIVHCGALEFDDMAAMRVTWLHLTDVPFGRVRDVTTQRCLLW